MVAIADTVAQNCTSGVEISDQITDSKRWLLPTKNHLRGVDNNRLTVRGTLLINVTSDHKNTTELLYIYNNVKGFYLSQTALRQMNVIKNTFPDQERDPLVHVTTFTTPETVTTQYRPEPFDANLAPCGCLLRSPCPPAPSTILFPPTEEYCPQIEDWIKKYFASSAFNTCKHQSLQTMSGEPLKISCRSDFTPSAVHTPIPIPHHWKKDVKAQLDADVALGNPTTWCYCSLKKGRYHSSYGRFAGSQ